MRGMTAALGFRLETDRRLETRDTARHRLRNGDLLCLLFGCGTTHHALATLVRRHGEQGCGQYGQQRQQSSGEIERHGEIR